LLRSLTWEFDGDSFAFKPQKFKPAEKVDLEALFTGLPSLTKLDLSCNWLRDSISLTPLAATLQVLNLSRNDLTQLDAAHFSPKFTSLMTLDLRRNALTTLPSGFLSLFPVLDTLDLGDNLISSLPDNLGRSRSLKKIVLSGNKLQSLPSNIYESLGPRVCGVFLYFFFWL